MGDLVVLLLTPFGKSSLNLRVTQGGGTRQTHTDSSSEGSERPPPQSHPSDRLSDGFGVRTDEQGSVPWMDG